MSPLSGTSLPVHSHYSLVVVREAPVQYQYSVDHMTICTYIRNSFCATVTVITMFVLWREYHKLTLITKSLRKFVVCLCSLSRLKKICFYIHVKYLKSCELLKASNIFYFKLAFLSTESLHENTNFCQSFKFEISLILPFFLSWQSRLKHPIKNFFRLNFWSLSSENLLSLKKYLISTL